MSRWGLLAGALLLIFGSAGAPARATTEVDFGDAFLEEVRELFFEVAHEERRAPEAEVRLDPAKLRAYRAALERKLRFVRGHVASYERLERGRSAKQARKRAASRDSVLALERALELLDAIEAERQDVARQQRLAADVVMLDYATRAYTDPIGSIKIPVHLWNMVFDWSFPNRQRPGRAEEEASNLVDPATGHFLTPEELAERMRRGEDLSLLEPPRESAFWRAHEDIGAVNVEQHYLGGGIPVQRGAPAVFPPLDGARVQLEKVHVTQSKPKLDVTWMDAECRARPKKKRKRCKRSYKLKFGMETHADPVANALIATLGYNADLAMHVRHLRVDLGDMSFEELERQWTAYFDLQRVHTFIPLSSVMSGRGRDEHGEYVLFPSAVAEYKPSEIERIGFWAFDEGYGSTSREARGLGLFNVWIANADMKDEENNKLSLRRVPLAEGGRPGEQPVPTSGGDDAHPDELRIYLTEQDLGHAFSVVLPERVDSYPWEAIESSPWSRAFGWLRGRTELNYMNLQQAGLEWRTTYADAKWMARRIAQLRREQIETAVSYGRWPGGVGALLTEKLIHRRNQIVRYYELEDEYGQLAVDRYITTPDGSVVNGEMVQGRFPGETLIRYDGHTRDVIMPALSYTWDRMKEGVQSGIGSLDGVDPGNFVLTGELRIAPELLLKVSRRIFENPAATTRHDQFIVEDEFGLGFRLGIGRGAYVDGSWQRKVSLSYPVPTRRAGINAKNELLPWMLWRDVRAGALPDRYVLAREDSWKGGLRALTRQGFEPAPAIDASGSRVWSERSVVDHRGAIPVVYHDAPRYWDGRVRGYVHLWLINLPLLEAGGKLGHAKGQAWRLDAPGAVNAAAFDELRRYGRFDEGALAALASEGALQVDARFRAADDWLGIIVASHQRRRKEERVAVKDAQGAPRLGRLVVSHERERAWAVLDNGEVKRASVAAVLDEGPESAPQLRLDWHVDDLNTHSRELDAYYQLLLDLGELEAGARDIIAPDFRAQDWEVTGERTGRWTRMKTSASVHLQAKMLDALCAAEPSQGDAPLAKRVGLDVERLRAYRAARRASPVNQRRRVRNRLPAHQWRNLLRAESVWRKVGRACKEAEPRARLRGLVSALSSASRDTEASFDVTALMSLLEAAGAAKHAASGNLVVDARIHKAFENEHNLPERRDVVGRRGELEARVEIGDFRLFPRDPVAAWTRLDWVNEVASQTNEAPRESPPQR